MDLFIVQSFAAPFSNDIDMLFSYICNITLKMSLFSHLCMVGLVGFLFFIRFSEANLKLCNFEVRPEARGFNFGGHIYYIWNILFKKIEILSTKT